MKKAFIEPGNDYVQQAWATALAPLNVKVETTYCLDHDYVLKYQDYDNYDFDTRSARTQWVYSYIYRKGITRKNYLGHTIQQYRAKRPDSVLHGAWPDSYDLEIDYPEFLDDALDENWDLKQELQTNKIWILKPALGERAHGIHLFRSQADLQAIFDEMLSSDEEDEEGNSAQMRQYVVQEYVTNPLLIHDRKFHLRVYCLCVGQLRVYVNQPMLTLFSAIKYDPENLKDLKSHLTNTCFQGEQAPVSLLSHEVSAGDCEFITNQVNQLVQDLFAAATSDPINFQSLPNAFEFYGIDVLVTTDRQVKLLEVNAYPDFKQTGPTLRSVVDNMFTETAALLVNNVEPHQLKLVYNREK